MSALRIWIDLANTPNVLFFEPVVRALEAHGHVVTLTARQFAGTVPLAAARGLPAQVIGAGHDADRDPARKQQLFEARSDALMAFARGRGFDVAASHASFTQAEAARRLGIPTFGALDYEGVLLHSFAAARVFMVPAVVPPAAFAARGVPLHAIRHYDGLKEHVYLAGFRPDPSIRARLGVGEDERLVTFRPIASHAFYLDADDDHVEQALLERLAREPGVRVLVLARTETQARALAPLAERWPAIRLCNTPLDGPSLIGASDLVVCGGGTMLREAAVLGVPAVTIFPGRLGAVDRWLIDAGRVRLVRSAPDAERLCVERRPLHPPAPVPGTALEQIVQGICDTARTG